MAEWKEYSAKTVDEALTNALVEMETTSDQVEYEILDKGSSGILGLLSKPAKIKVRKSSNVKDIAISFLNKVFDAMELEVAIDLKYDEVERKMSIDLSGDEMGILIGKRGITLDSLQYLLSLVVNKQNEEYIKIKLDTENYRERRRETLENLANNLAHKVKRTHHPVYLEPMNPYERRVIHSALQKDKSIETYSEGDEPYRKVVITLKPGADTGYQRRGKYSYGNNNYDNNRSYGGRSYNRNGGYRRNNEGNRNNYRGYDRNFGNNAERQNYDNHDNVSNDYGSQNNEKQDVENNNYVNQNAENYNNDNKLYESQNYNNNDNNAFDAD